MYLIFPNRTRYVYCLCVSNCNLPRKAYHSSPTNLNYLMVYMMKYKTGNSIYIAAMVFYKYNVAMLLIVDGDYLNITDL